MNNIEWEVYVANQFNDLLAGKREEIIFSRGYDIFEEIYEELKDYLEREEIGNDEVLLRVKK